MHTTVYHESNISALTHTYILLALRKKTVLFHFFENHSNEAQRHHEQPLRSNGGAGPKAEVGGDFEAASPCPGTQAEAVDVLGCCGGRPRRPRPESWPPRTRGRTRRGRGRLLLQLLLHNLPCADAPPSSRRPRRLPVPHRRRGQPGVGIAAAAAAGVLPAHHEPDA